VGDHVFLRVSPTKGVMRFGIKGKLSPQFIGPFEVLDRVGEVAYRLALPPMLVGVHNVFHVSMLRKYVPDHSHVVAYKPLQLREDLTYEEQPVRIVDKKEQELRRHTHGFKNRTGEITGKGSGSRTSGPTGVGPVVEPVTS
jgi:hypothetical protein